MDPRANPYTPNAGARPPALTGRDGELASFEVLLTRLQGGYAEQSMLVTGLRGVGKTALLGAFGEVAERVGWIRVEAEISRTIEFGPRMARLLRRAFLAVAPKASWQARAKRAAAVVRSFTLTVDPDGSLSAGLDVDPAEGIADSGDLGEDLADALTALGEAAADRGTGVVLLFDEIQLLAREEFEALIVALHRTVQRNLPITMVGAGLPQLPRLAGEAKSYAERLFRFPSIGRLGDHDARRALVEPAGALAVELTDEAAGAVLRYTEGYPYLIQEYGRTVWDMSHGTPITRETVEAAQADVEGQLDEGFFRVRAERSTPAELQYLRAMAELGAGAQRAADVAKVLGRTSEQLGPVRARLIQKGLLYTPSYGNAAFTVPQFDRFMKRTQPLESGRPTHRRDGGR